MKPVRKAVFPVAGLGTRFLPATKAMPKEMLPVVDKPLIQYAVEEAAAAGITDMIFITGRYKRAIEDHFDKSPELEADLTAKGKYELLDLVHSVTPRGVNFIFIRQPEPLGLGHAVLCARPVVGDEPFGVILADDLIYAQQPALGQLIGARSEMGGGSVLAVQNVAPKETNKYGIVGVDDELKQTSCVRTMVESLLPKRLPRRLPSSAAMCLSRKSLPRSNTWIVVWAAKSSSPTPSLLCWAKARPMPTALKVVVLTAAASRAS